ncbi:MAG: LuxR C-terminal-related transcriptional regulator [Roseobacter sp.]
MRSYAIVLTPPSLQEGIQPHVVAHLVEGTHTPSFQRHIAEVYNLTTSESAVLSQFVSGQTLEHIAVSRRRSAATVKKQFYALMSKFKVKSQSELLQHVMTLSKIYDVPDPTQKTSAHPDRQETKVLRPHGRVVEVALAGDMFGTPVLMVPTLFQRCFPAQVEQHLKRAGILMITVVPPGRGKTSRPRQGISVRACFVDDIVAVLDQLSIDRAILFGTDDILRLAVLLAQEIPDRLTHILVTAPVLPISYEKASRHRDNFIPSSKKLQLLKPAMKTLSLALFWQSLTILHAKGMIRLFLRNDPIDLRVCLEPDTLKEVSAAFDSVISAGFETGAKHHLSTFDDWETHIKDCPVPITIYEGTKSRLCDRGVLRRFVDDFPTVIKLVEFETAGTSFPYVRPDLMIEMILACQIRSE